MKKRCDPNQVNIRHFIHFTCVVLKEEDDSDDWEGELERGLVSRPNRNISKDVAQRAEEEEDKRELSSLQEVLNASRNAKAVAESNAPTAPKPLSTPTQVVKRITRRISETGQETIEIRFIISEEEVHRVLKQERRREKVLAKRKTDALFEVNNAEHAERQAMSINLANLKQKVPHHMFFFFGSKLTLPLLMTGKTVFRRRAGGYRRRRSARVRI